MKFLIPLFALVAVSSALLNIPILSGNKKSNLLKIPVNAKVLSKVVEGDNSDDGCAKPSPGGTPPSPGGTPPSPGGTPPSPGGTPPGPDCNSKQ